MGSLTRPPEARAESVEELIRKVDEGRVRIPNFQRGLLWGAGDVIQLFDSIYRGLPIGSLLLQKRKAAAGTISIGPLTIDAPNVSDAWWVVDGQQRLTSLAAGLSRATPIPRTPTDPYVVYFNSDASEFRAPPKDGKLPASWVPAPLLLDSTQLGEWILDWSERNDRGKVRAVFDAGKRIREYRVPLYIVESSDPELLREIFFRVNKSGKELSWEDVHDALYGHDGSTPGTTAQLAEEVASLGMGAISRHELTTCLVALRGLDVTRTLAEHRAKDPEVLRGAVAEAAPVLKQVLSFLRKRAEIPHLRLLPRTFVLEVLTRFFVLHPEPSQRTTELLSRWVWRALLAPKAFDERTLTRRGIASIDTDEEGSVQQLLKIVPRKVVPVTLPEAFDARSASSRLAALVLASLAPKDLVTGETIDLPRLIEEKEALAFRVVIPLSKASTARARAASNRALHSGTGALFGVLGKHIRDTGTGGGTLVSHGISPEAARAFVEGKYEDFLRLRAEYLDAALRKSMDRLAGWSKNDRDRPSIRYLAAKGKD